jgi:hypothetical protein
LPLREGQQSFSLLIRLLFLNPELWYYYYYYYYYSLCLNNYEHVTLQTRVGWSSVIRFLTKVMSGFPFIADVLIGMGAHSASIPFP